MSVFVPPRLDVRTWEELRRELIRRIPVHNPEWTDFSATDPGITLVELFAWLAENLLRRMDRVPEAAHAEILRLLNVPPRPAQPSRALVRVSLPAGALGPALIERRPGEHVPTVAAGRLSFELLDEVDVLALEAIGAVRRALAAPPDDVDPVGPLQILKAHLDMEDQLLEAAWYETIRLSAPGVGDGETQHCAETIDGALWVALVVPAPVLKATPGGMDAARRALAGRILSLGVGVDTALDPWAPWEGGADALPPSPDVRWEVTTPDARSAQDVRLVTLQVMADRTAGVTRPGVVRLQLPTLVGDLGVPDVRDGDDRSMTGTGALPPALDDEALEARIAFWVRATRPENAAVPGKPPSVRWVDVNMVTAEQAAQVGFEPLGVGSGRASATFRLSRAPVLGSVVVEVLEDTSLGWVAWEQVPDLSTSRGDDPHYALDAATGILRFGDGIHGRVLQPGEAARARPYRTGGGAAGNVAPGQINRIVAGFERAPGVKVTNPLAGSGGQDSETLPEAIARIPSAVRHRDRAVAASDFRDLAMATPGGGIGRVKVLPRRLPRDETEVLGVVTLVIVPDSDPLHPDRPTPDQELLRRVCQHLEPRRLVTTELYTTGPEWAPIGISVAIEIKEGYGISTVRSWVDLGLRQAFAPLPPYGPAGDGWPFGRDILLADVHAAVLQVEGVRLVRQVRLWQYDGEGGVAGELGGDDAVVLAPWELPVLSSVSVTEGRVAEAPAALAPKKETVAVAVPVVWETC